MFNVSRASGSSKVPYCIRAERRWRVAPDETYTSSVIQTWVRTSEIRRVPGLGFIQTPSVLKPSGVRYDPAPSPFADRHQNRISTSWTGVSAAFPPLKQPIGRACHRASSEEPWILKSDGRGVWFWHGQHPIIGLWRQENYRRWTDEKGTCLWNTTGQTFKPVIFEV